MNILFVHQQFPAQFKHLAPALAADPVNRVVVMHMRPDVPVASNIRYLQTIISRGNTPGIHPWLHEFETKVIRGEASWQTALMLKNEGFIPDLIYAHPGWGESLFLKEVWPTAKLLCYCEFYYHTSGLDAGFDPEFPLLPDDVCRIQVKNANNLLSLDSFHAGISPTWWQRSTYPVQYQDKISVIHDGIDTDLLIPNPEISCTLGSGASFSRQHKIITFINRNMEPCRGIHSFFRAIPEIQKLHPDAHILVVGSEGVYYGAQPEGNSYKEQYLQELGDRIDLQRVHFLGKLDYAAFVGLLQLSTVHVYLTYPFVLSWSVLEAMSCECLVVGSRTPPVEEVIRHGENGLLVDFFSPDEIAAAVDEALTHPDRMQPLRAKARQTVIDRYDLKRICLPQQLATINNTINNK